MSRLYPYFLSCWLNYTVTEQQLESAVAKGYITEEEKNEIIATPR